MIDRRTFLLMPLAAAAAERKPNVLLLVARGWRGQATPWAGDPDLVAPMLEEFAKESVVFPHAYSAYPRSTPARAALVTGRYPHTTGVIKDDDNLPPGEVTIGAVLKDAGYQVGAADVTVANRFIETNRTVPFFFQATLEPARTSRPYDPAAFHPRANIPSAAEPEARRHLANYYGLWSALDHSMDDVLTTLDRVGCAQNTIVVFTSDHGQQIGSHGLDGDDVAFEESVRVPLAIRYPGVLARGAASDLLVSTVDLMPTLLGLCGETPLEGIQGHDLSGLLTGKAGDRPESVYTEGKIGQKDEWRMLVLASDKIVVNAQNEVTHVFNLADDPHELTNLAHDPAVQLKRDQLLALLRASGRRLADFKRR